ncbi:class F sortase [Streptomyces sp. F001]|uniref:class F sortase n=1 Tax=Streptomyces sp. F001 TaxID=1510026 RepID=UPI0013EE629A|nr:class F sortase [Streptomyces sp. F001]
MPAQPSSPTDDEQVPSGQGSHGGMIVLCAVVLLILTVRLIGGDDTPSDSSRPAHAPPAPHATAPAMPGPHATGRHLPRSKPVRLLIPKISVDAPFTDLAIGSNGQLEPPPAHDVNLVGWHAEGASPGEAGTSIVAGHVDTATSPAVFADLGALQKGDVFHVERADGRTASFVVDSVETFAKDRFPSRRVYGDTPQAQVRLITCAGDYDRTVKDYTDNLVVFAHLM